VANGGTGLTTTPANGALDIGNGTGFTRTTLTAGSNITITNASGAITIAATGSSGVTSVTGTSPVVSSGGTTPAISLATAYGDTLNPYASKTANYILAAPNGTSGVPTFRAIVAADIPTLNQNTTGSAATLTTTRAIYGNNFDGSAALTQVIASTYGGTGNGFAKFSGPATAEKTFTLPNATATILTDNAAVTVLQGGTGATTQTAYAVLCGGTTATGAYQSIAGVGTTGQVLTSNGAGALPTFQSAGGGFPATTAMLFVQTAAPTGWTKLTTHDNKALRIVSGTAGTGGSVAFTTAFASGLSAGATTLSTAQMPSHTHSTNIRTYNFCPEGSTLNVATSNPTTGGYITSGSTGSSSSHDHSLPSFAVQYVDVIIATKN